MQGEADAAMADSVLYEANLRDFIVKVRAVLGEPDLKIVLGQINPTSDQTGDAGPGDPRLVSPDMANVRNAQALVAASDVNVTLVSSEGILMRDDVHFSPLGNSVMAARFANAFIAVDPALLDIPIERYVDGTDMADVVELDSPQNTQTTLGAGADTANGSAAFDLIYGESGRDIIHGLSGDDFLFGGEDDDEMSGGDGIDVLFGGTGDDNLFGDASEDFLSGNLGIDRLWGGTGHDILHGNAGNDQLRGGSDEDLLFGEDGADELHGEAGADVLLGGGDADLMTGGEGRDRLWGESGDDALAGNGGNDTLDGGDGADDLRGGTGDDIYSVDNAGDAVGEGTGDGTDLVRASVSYTLSANVEKGELFGEASISLDGNELDNVLTGNVAANTLFGGSGADSLAGNGGHDKLFGGTGTDTADYSAATSDTTVILLNFDGVPQPTFSSGSDSLSSIENLTGSAFNDKLVGNASSNVIRGGAGGDTINGYGGGDFLFGEAGNDGFRASSGPDAFDGGTGVDFVNYSVQTEAVSAFLDGSGTNGRAALGDTFTAIENLIGSGIGNDLLIGDAGGNRLAGLGGNDTLRGRAGGDLLNGGAGDDTLIGDQGADVIVTGSGLDTIVFNRAALAAERDRITDFVSGSDTLRINAAVFGGGLVAGGLVQLVANSNPGAANGNATFLYDTGTGVLKFDADGNGAGAAETFAWLQFAHTLAASDFDLI